MRMVGELKCQETLRIHLFAAACIPFVSSDCCVCAIRYSKTRENDVNATHRCKAFSGTFSCHSRFREYAAAKLIMRDNREQPRNFLNKIYMKKSIPLSEIYCLEIKVLIDFVKLSRRCCIFRIYAITKNCFPIMYAL